VSRIVGVALLLLGAAAASAAEVPECDGPAALAAPVCRWPDAAKVAALALSRELRLSFEEALLLVRRLWRTPRVCYAIGAPFL
jgi:hypothetical protein